MKSVISMLIASASATYHQAAEPIANSYLIKFKEGTPEAIILEHKNVAKMNSAVVERDWSFGNFKGYAASIKDKNLVAKIEQMPEVEFVEEDGVVRLSEEELASSEATCITQKGATWGITRTSEKMLNPDGLYSYVDLADGTGVTVYVIDTGIYIQNVEFGTRAIWGTNTVDTKTTDGNGHGTHCAGTIGGNTYGLAKKAKLVAVKVLSDSGSGSTAGVISGIDWAVKNKGPPEKIAIGSMSLGGAKSAGMNSAVANAVGAGLIMVVAAGNDNKNACDYSPASSPEAITVAASDNTDTKATFSNYGDCVNLFAPGVAITSAWIGGTNAVNTISGTSMACPHVAGQVAKYVQINPTATGAVAKAWVISTAQQGLIKKITPAVPVTPNLLLFADCRTFGGLTNETMKLSKRY
jgi:subtilisin family serine protease